MATISAITFTCNPVIEYHLTKELRNYLTDKKVLDQKETNLFSKLRVLSFISLHFLWKGVVIALFIRKYYCTVKTVFINPNPHPTPPLKHLIIDVFLDLNMRHTWGEIKKITTIQIFAPPGNMMLGIQPVFRTMYFEEKSPFLCVCHCWQDTLCPKNHDINRNFRLSLCLSLSCLRRRLP